MKAGAYIRFVTSSMSMLHRILNKPTSCEQPHNLHGIRWFGRTYDEI